MLELILFSLFTVISKNSSTTIILHKVNYTFNSIKKLRYHDHSEVFYPFFLNGIVFCAVSCNTFNLCSKLSNRFLPSSSVINSKRTAKFISLDKPNIWVSSTSSYKGHWGVIKLYEEVLDTQMFGLSREINFGCRVLLRIKDIGASLNY